MDTKHAVIASLGQADFVVEAYLADLSPTDMLVRPVPGINHIAWQLGHLISSERYLVDKAVPGMMAALPAGFAERHSKSQATSDNPADFLSKEEYQRIWKQVRGETLRVVESRSPADFDKPVGEGLPPMIKTVGQTLLFIGAHWLMHAGQWVVIRRKLGRPPLF